MNELNMEYNSQRELLVIPEYGRNIQKLIEYAKTIEDPKFRQAFAENIIDLMMQMHPQNRNLDDYREKLWKHIFVISDFELDVVPPSGKKYTKEESVKRPDPIGYPVTEAKYRHYGHNVQVLVKKALSMPPGPKREGFVAVIGNYMKLAYKTWNKEHYVSDEVIKADLESLSNGELELPDDTSLDNLTKSTQRRKRSNGSSGSSKSRGRGRRKK